MTVKPSLWHGAQATEAYDVRIVQWSFLRRLMTPRQRALYDHWVAASDGTGVLEISAFDPLEVWDCVGFMHILQYDAARMDFFYRIYGEATARSALACLHQHWVMDHPGCAGTKFRDHYLEVMGSGRPWLGEVYTVDQTYVAPYWNRIVLPLVDPADPQGFACVTLAEPHEVIPSGETMSANSLM